jgi:hypothetical protein
MAENRRRGRLPQLTEGLRRWLEAPQQRTLRDQVQRLSASSQGRALREQLRRLTPLRQQQQLPSLVRQLDQPPAKRKRKTGGGRRTRLTDEEAMELRQSYQRALRRDPTLRKHEAAVEWLRPRLPKAKRDVHPETLKRHVIRPVLAALSK